LTQAGFTSVEHFGQPRRSIAICVAARTVHAFPVSFGWRRRQRASRKDPGRPRCRAAAVEGNSRDRLGGRPPTVLSPKGLTSPEHADQAIFWLLYGLGTFLGVLAVLASR